MKQTFEGQSTAVNFAQTESKKMGKKLSVFLTRTSGVQYVVCDSKDAETIVGKLLGSYGEDVVVKPIQPIPVIEVKPEPIPEPEAIAEVPDEQVTSEPTEPEQTAPEKPKRTRKPKTDE